ncbi:hypothetical protein [Chitinophaga sp.]|uniref:hypothetical protein n=1 Tax=Chitinophaga sp. TaxID=1869181 RepID=UPI0031DF02C6
MSKGIIGYVATPNGMLLKYDPNAPLDDLIARNDTKLISTNMPSDPRDPSGPSCEPKVQPVDPKPKVTPSQQKENKPPANPNRVLIIKIGN